MGRIISDYYPGPPGTFRYNGHFAAFRYFLSRRVQSSSKMAKHVHTRLLDDPRIDSHKICHSWYPRNGMRIVEVTVRYTTNVNWMQDKEHVGAFVPCFFSHDTDYDNFRPCLGKAFLITPVSTMYTASHG
jgi:hypothetical protein